MRTLSRSVVFPELERNGLGRPEPAPGPARLPLLRQRAATRPVVVLTGARQTGKTSLMRRLFPEHAFVTLDLPSEAEQAERDPASFLARYPPPVIVDEVQYAPGLFRHLKTAVDRDRGRAGAFLLTGSQSLGLMKSVSDSLAGRAGRAGIVELEPLIFAEARAAHPRLAVEEFLVRGGFPELYENLTIDAEGFLRSYVATYLERDLRQLLQVASLRDYERFLRAAALRSAQLLNRADLARNVGISGSTAAAWLSALAASHQVTMLEPWFSNRTKALVKRPKLHVRDAGLTAFLCGVHTIDALRTSPLAGARAADLWRRRTSQPDGRAPATTVPVEVRERPQHCHRHYSERGRRLTFSSSRYRRETRPAPAGSREPASDARSRFPFRTPWRPIPFGTPATPPATPPRTRLRQEDRDPPSRQSA